MAGGGFVVWDVASAISRAAHLATATKVGDLPAVPTRKDEIGTLMSSFAKMLATIEQQTDEINQFPRRLDQLARQAFRDSLTSLPNRSLFMDRLAHALTRTERRGEQLAVLFLDLDRFKVVNDSLGHGVGDQLLIGVSQRLAACLRPEDTIARLGGDEFAILIEDVKDDKAPASVADRLTAELQQPFTVEGREVVDHGEHRHRDEHRQAHDPRGHPARRRSGHVPRQGQGQGPLRDLRQEHERARAGAHGS